MRFYTELISNRTKILYQTNLEPIKLLYMTQLKSRCKYFSLVILKEPKRRVFLLLAELTNQTQTYTNPLKKLLTSLILKQNNYFLRKNNSLKKKNNSRWIYNNVLSQNKFLTKLKNVSQSATLKNI